MRMLRIATGMQSAMRLLQSAFDRGCLVDVMLFSRVFWAWSEAFDTEMAYRMSCKRRGNL